MKACRIQPENREPSDTIEFVPRKELDRAQRQIEQQQERIERLQPEADRLKQEIERLRQEPEAALRASKRQAAPHSRGELKPNPKPPGRQTAAQFSALGVTEISRTICELLEWKRPNGKLQHHECRQLLELHPDKTRRIEFGRYAEQNRTRRGEGTPETFDFLGFTHLSG